MDLQEKCRAHCDREMEWRSRVAVESMKIFFKRRLAGDASMTPGEMIVYAWYASKDNIQVMKQALEMLGVRLRMDRALDVYELVFTESAAGNRCIQNITFREVRRTMDRMGTGIQDDMNMVIEDQAIREIRKREENGVSRRRV